MTNKEFAEKIKNVATKYKTLYVLGCFGSPLNASNKKRYTNNYSYNKQTSRAKMINAASSDTFGFDCVCLIKGILWGWNGDKSRTYGGASYAVNGVPDIGADKMISVCKDVSTNFSNIEIGEAVWVPGHIGVYIGDGLVVECTPIWKNGVQITACNRDIAGYNRRNWTKHGKLPYIEYIKETTTTNASTNSSEIKLELAVLRQGAKNNTVKGLQALLIGYGYSCGSDGADGNFGAATLAAVKKYQKDNGIGVDGVVGIKTWSKLLGV